MPSKPTLKDAKERQLVKQLKNIQNKKDRLKLDANKIEEEFKNKKDQIEKELAQLETTYNNLTSQCEALQKNITDLEQQRSNVKTQWDISHSFNLAVQNAQLTNTINTQRAGYNMTLNQATQAKRQASALLQTQNQLTAQYQQNNQELIEQIGKLEKSEKLIAGKTKTPPAESDLSAASKSNSISKCFTLDFEMEKQKIMASFSPVTR